MPIITAIKPQKNKKRVNVYLDGEFSFGLDLENYVKLGLKLEQSLTEEKITEIIFKAEYRKVLDKLLRFVTTRPRSTKEVYNWFKKYEVTEKIQPSLVDKITEFGFLDDLEFAKWWIHQRNQFRPRGVALLKSELSQKGINKDIIQKALSITEVDEESQVTKVLEKKRRMWEKEVNLNKKREKVARILLSRGYGWETIKRVINTLLNKKNEL